MTQTERVRVIEIDGEAVDIFENIIKRLRLLEKQNKISEWGSLAIGIFDLITASPAQCSNNRLYELFYKAIKNLDLDKNMFMVMKERLEKELKHDEYAIILTDRFLNLAMFYIKSQNNILTQI